MASPLPVCFTDSFVAPTPNPQYSVDPAVRLYVRARPRRPGRAPFYPGDVLAKILSRKAGAFALPQLAPLGPGQWLSTTTVAEPDAETRDEDEGGRPASFLNGPEIRSSSKVKWR